MPSRNDILNLILDCSNNNRYIQFSFLTWGCSQGLPRTLAHFHSTVPACTTSWTNSETNCRSNGTV